MQRTKSTIPILGCATVVAVVLVTGPAVDARTPVERTWKIALASNRQGDSEIYSMNADGTHVRRLTDSPKVDGPGPWSPDGRKLLFYSQRTGGDVWIMNPDGTGQRNLSRNPAWDAPGGWSPDGSKILFTSNRDGNNELYVMNADGTGQRNLRPSPSSQEWGGSWSPDGRTIAFSSDRSGNWEIYAMNPDGTHLRNLTRNPRNDGGTGFAGMGWTPNGRLVFASTRDTHDVDDPELYSMKADGTDVRRLTRRVGLEGVLSISPDGRRLAMWRYPTKPRWAFFVMNANGSGVRKVNWALPSGHR
jgi:Tol biopolymer transport system component